LGGAGKNEERPGRSDAGRGKREEDAVSNEEKDAANPEAAADKSERILEDAYLTGAVGMATTPRLSASTLKGGGDDSDLNVFEDASWASHAIEEGDAGDAPAKPKGLGARFRRMFGG